MDLFQGEGVVTSSIVVNPHLSISVMVSPAGQGHGFVKGILETGGVMDKCVQMWTRNYGALGQTAQETGGDSTGEVGSKRTRDPGRERGDGKRVGERESEARLEWRKGLSPEIGVKKTMNAGGVENGTMN
ncbi:hypothetical protein TNCV_3405741 [Trichonephila clavipes]|nr:hypothetical protein TNCV_3405741 [Trichonephila clavipes]